MGVPPAPLWRSGAKWRKKVGVFERNWGRKSFRFSKKMRNFVTLIQKAKRNSKSASWKRKK